MFYMGDGLFCNCHLAYSSVSRRRWCSKSAEKKRFEKYDLVILDELGYVSL